jgi:hypothetical protein
MWKRKNINKEEKLYNGTQRGLIISFGNSRRSRKVFIEFAVFTIPLLKLAMIRKSYFFTKGKSLLGNLRGIFQQFE